MLQRFLALIIFINTLPLLIILYLLVKLTSPGPFFFKQKRLGKNKKPFTIYKIRTMVLDAEALKRQYLDQNEADGPVFKIRNDPRYTALGKWLSRTGLDELPQLINIIRGEMAFIGPRPLPVDEAQKIPTLYKKRFSVLPGITSPWVISGSHSNTFKQWMELDLDYIEKKTLPYDLQIAGKTLVVILNNLVK